MGGSHLSYQDMESFDTAHVAFRAILSVIKDKRLGGGDVDNGNGGGGGGLDAGSVAVGLQSGLDHRANANLSPRVRQHKRRMREQQPTGGNPRDVSESEAVIDAWTWRHGMIKAPNVKVSSPMGKRKKRNGVGNSDYAIWRKNYSAYIERVELRAEGGNNELLQTTTILGVFCVCVAFTA